MMKLLLLVLFVSLAVAQPPLFEFELLVPTEGEPTRVGYGAAYPIVGRAVYEFEWNLEVDEGLEITNIDYHEASRFADFPTSDDDKKLVPEEFSQHFANTDSFSTIDIPAYAAIRVEILLPSLTEEPQYVYAWGYNYALSKSWGADFRFRSCGQGGSFPGVIFNLDIGKK